MQGPEKNSYKEFDNEKKLLQLENAPLPPPITFLMVRPLVQVTHVTETGNRAQKSLAPWGKIQLSKLFIFLWYNVMNINIQGPKRQLVSLLSFR